MSRSFWYRLTTFAGFHSWSRLGNVVSSMFALGYHENVEKSKPPIPNFLAELRKAAWAITYSADKNVAIFLGRPPRMSKRFCHFQIPLNPPNAELGSVANAWDRTTRWQEDTPFCYRAGIRWAALCSALKEDILELLRDRQQENFDQKAR